VSAILIALEPAHVRVILKLAEDALVPPCDDPCGGDFRCQHAHTAGNEDIALREIIRRIEDAERRPT
jgi:hypothetical protein